MASQRRVTISDVARLAGLSTASVSRALTGARPVKPDIAERVEVAARQLGYRPDAIARSLRRQQTGTIGLVVADISNPFFPSLVQAVEGQTRKNGLGLLLADAQNSPDIEKAAVHLLLDARVDALLIAPSHRFLSREVISDASAVVPVIQLDRVVDESIGHVRIDQTDAIRKIIAQMRLEGRTHIAFVGSDPTVPTSWERQQAFLAVAPMIDPDAADRVLAGDFTVHWGRTAAARILRTWPEVDGIICANDEVAFGVFQALIHMGVDVEKNVSIVGFDDSLIARAGNLSSIRQPVQEMAAIAVESAVSGSGATGKPFSVNLTSQLIVRKAALVVEH